MKRLAVLTGLLLLTGCGHSPPTQFFTLDAAPPGHTPPFKSIAPVQLDAVHIPAVLDRPEVVTQIAAGRLKLDEQAHWGAPLGDMMRRTLAQDILARLPAGSFVLPGAPKLAGVRGLVVNVLQLQAGANGQVYFEASWSLMVGEPSRAVLTRDVELRASTQAGPAGEAAALSTILGELADQIASAVSAPREGSGATS